MICQHFWPEEFRINDICKSLVEMGYEVDVISGIPNYPHGRYFDGYSAFKKRMDNYEGINIYRSFVIPRGNGNPIQIFMNYISYPIFSISKLLKLRKRKYDRVLVYQLTPVFMAYPAILAKKLFKIKSYIYIQDLWPESLYSVYDFKSKCLKKIFDKISIHIYKQFDFYLTTSKGIKKKIESEFGIRGDKVFYLPNWAEDFYEVNREDENLINKYKDTFNVVFAGNIGPAQSFETILEAAKNCKLRGYSKIKWLIIGDGMTKEWAENQVAKLGISDVVEFIGRKPAASMPEYYNVSDVLLVSLVKSDLFSITIPSKVQSYLASGKPIIASLDGEGADIILESKSGLVSSSGDSEKLAENAIKMYLMDKEELDTMGNNASKYYKTHFKKNVVLENLVNILQK
ncbi:glycosyltransferase family 4 protein [Paenibacillus sp. NPDC093718]|uniref:glycosyltransferase family 4 protein n=1 Tax=Paenibacillus sp. NPDC093718 TaxID=3390601 RepID=UPI003CFE1528